MLKTCGDGGDKAILVPCLKALVLLEPAAGAGVGTVQCCGFHDDGGCLHSQNAGAI